MHLPGIRGPLGWFVWLASACDAQGAAVHETDGTPLVTVAPCAERSCRVVARRSLPHAELAEALAIPPERISFEGSIAYQTGEVVSVLPAPHPARGGKLLRISPNEPLVGADLSAVTADAFMVAGRKPAEQIVALVTGIREASTALLDPSSLQLGEHHAIVEGVQYFGQTAQVASAPARDGLRSVFAIGNRVVGPLDVGIIGADAVPGTVSRVCERGENCTCLRVIPTEHAGMVSFVEEPLGAGRDETRWRVVELDETGKIVRDASAPIPGPASCPVVANSEEGPVAIVRRAEGEQLLSLADPEHPTRLSGVGGGGIHGLVGFRVSGSEVTLVEHGEVPSVVRVIGGVVDEASRLRLPGARDVSVVAGQEGEMVLLYGTDSSEELVTVSCSAQPS